MNLIIQLRTQNAKQSKKIAEMENDIQTAIGAIKGVLDELGIDPAVFKDEKVKIGKIISKVLPKIIAGNVQFSELQKAFPIVEKYEYLIPKTENNA